MLLLVSALKTLIKKAIMNKNEIFRKFMQNPLIKEKVDLTDKQLMSIDLFNETPNRLIDVIKTTILHLESDQSIDLVARKINQSFKRDTI